MREFVVTAGNQSLTMTSTNPLIAFTPASAPSVNIECLRFWVGQFANATSAQVNVFLQTVGSSFPTTASTTPSKLKPADPNASILVGATYVSFAGVGITATSPGQGAITVVHNDAFNVLNGWLQVPTPAETRIMNTPALSTGQPCLELCLGSVGTGTGWCFGMTYREV